MSVAVVTDSTADLPDELVRSLDLRVVPLTVAFGGEEALSGLTLDTEGFYERLATADALPTTSQPASAWFEEAWGDAADEGHLDVVSIHVSSALSGTHDRAAALAPDAPLPVHVLDSGQVSAGLALQVLAAVRVAAAGGDVGAVRGAVEHTRATTTTLLVPDTLEYLRRGGRLTGAQALVGGALRVRPILTVVDGQVELADRARTWARARDRLVAMAAEAAGGRPVDLVVAHAVAPDRADELRAALAAVVEVVDEHVVGIGPVVGTHAGPGAVGLALAPREA